MLYRLLYSRRFLMSNLDLLKKDDTLPIVSFCLYKLSNNKKYANLSELAYTLDMNNFIKVCNYFGGQTINIPTINEMKLIINGLLVYYETIIEKKDIDKAIKDLNITENVVNVKNIYLDICNIMKDYEFSGR